MLLTGAAAELLTGWGAVEELLLAGVPWRSCCWPGRCCGEASRGTDVERQTVGADALVNERTRKLSAVNCCH